MCADYPQYVVNKSKALKISTKAVADKIKKINRTSRFGTFTVTGLYIIKCV